jgi:transcription-repair coupling factor (superfamily II helicase)
MRDLEIRGAGNILGTKQSGHILAVGFDLYCQLLKQAVSKLKGEKVKPRIEVDLRLDFIATNEADWKRADAGRQRTDFPVSHEAAPAFLPVSYIPEAPTRIQAYRKFSGVAAQEQLDGLRKGWRDRFGPLPDPVENLLLLGEIKIDAGNRRITRVEVRENKLMLTRGGDYVLIGGKFPRLTSKSPTLNLREVSALIKSF